jgi:hypothetical protein
MRNKDRLRLAVIFLAISWMILAGITGAESKEAPQVASEQQGSEKLLESNASGREIIVYYFHGTYRCPSCLQIEDWSFDVLQERFAPALEQGTIIWTTINIDKPENRHLVEAYQVSTQALIIVRMSGKKEKRYKNLGKVWEYLSDQQTFYDYVTHEINKFRTGN